VDEAHTPSHVAILSEVLGATFCVGTVPLGIDSWFEEPLVLIEADSAYTVFTRLAGFT
jgi:hypothetical protein